MKKVSTLIATQEADAREDNYIHPDSRRYEVLSSRSVANEVKMISSYGWRILRKRRLIASGVIRSALDGFPGISPAPPR